MKPTLIGRTLWTQARSTATPPARRYGGTSNAPLIFAITGIENALYDIAGKALGVPVYRLLGGKYRDQIRLYADLHAGDEETPQAYAAKAAEVVGEEGYTAVKFDVDHTGVGNRSLELDSRRQRDEPHHRAHPCRVKPLASRSIWRLTVTGSSMASSAITLAKAVEDLRLMWLEEPVPAENIDALAQVKASTSTVSAAGRTRSRVSVP